ncbi:MAG TPA: metallophosphoesterase, partial [Proteiniphilum sp.]|nr:metallophosphoesterase [Proteiniphilum sp.]
MRTLHLLFLFLTVITTACNPVSADSLKIALLSDIHLLSSKLYDNGEALAAYEQVSGRQFDDQEMVLEQVLRNLRQEEPDLLLISGDLTHHGEQLSHLDLVAVLHSLEKEGVRVLVVPGNHDINIPNAVAYRGDKKLPVESVTKDEFVALYESFGYGEALYRDEASLSYVATLDSQHWLLCFDSNRYEEHTTGSITAGRIKEQTREWALSVLRDAEEKGITVLGMMHHGLVEHMPYQSDFFPGYLVEEWAHHAAWLAEAKMPLVFTGHFHANDVTRFEAPSGHSIYDLETASLAQYPYAWRMMTLKEGSLTVESRFVKLADGNSNLEEEAYKRLEMVTRRVAEQRLRGVGILLPEELMPLLTDLIVKLNMMHVKGDEKADPEMQLALRLFASYLGN